MEIVFRIACLQSTKRRALGVAFVVSQRISANIQVQELDKKADSR